VASPQDECHEDRAADEPDDVGALVGEGLVDNRLHDPGGKGGRRRYYHQAEDRERVAPYVVTAVLRDHALEDACHGAGIEVRLLVFR